MDAWKRQVDRMASFNQVAKGLATPEHHHMRASARRADVQQQSGAACRQLLPCALLGRIECLKALQGRPRMPHTRQAAAKQTAEQPPAASTGLALPWAMQLLPVAHCVLLTAPCKHALACSYVQLPPSACRVLTPGPAVQQLRHALGRAHVQQPVQHRCQDASGGISADSAPAARGHARRAHALPATRGAAPGRRGGPSAAAAARAAHGGCTPLSAAPMFSVRGRLPCKASSKKLHLPGSSRCCEGALCPPCLIWLNTLAQKLA